MMMMMTNNNNSNSEQYNENTSSKEYKELVRRKQLYQADLKRRVIKLRSLKESEDKQRKQLLHEKQKLYREEKKERDYLTISVVLLLVAFGFGVVAVNYYTNFNGSIVGMAFLVVENNTLQEEFDLVINIPANNKEITKFIRIDKIDGKVISFDLQRSAEDKFKDLSDIIMINVGNEMAYIGTLPEKKKLDITSYAKNFCTGYPCKLPLKFSAQFETMIILEDFKQQINGTIKTTENTIRTEQPANKRQGDFISLGAFRDGEIKDVELKKYDTARFIIGNNQYRLQLDSISPIGAEISLLPAFDSIDLELTMPLRADLNNNELDDIIIILTNLDTNKATFSLQHLDETAENERNEESLANTRQSSVKKNTETLTDEDISEKIVVEKMKVVREKASNNDSDKENKSGSGINFFSWIVLFVLGIGIVYGISIWQDTEREKARERKKWAIERHYMEHGKLPHGVTKEDYEMLKKKKTHNAKKSESPQKNAHYEVLSMFVKEFKDKNYSREKIRNELVKRGWDAREIEHVIKMQEGSKVYSNIDSLVAFAEDAFKRNYNHVQIAKALHSKGWPKEVIIKVFREEKRLKKYLR